MPELGEVLAYALSLAEDSGGAYDVTVGPLVNLWGFGPDPATRRVPDAAAHRERRARAWAGARSKSITTKRRARKAPGVRVDLSSLGKGRGVDRVAEYLDAQGVTNYLIDLSGKLRARGVNVAWRAVARGRGAAASGRHVRRSRRLTPAIVALATRAWRPRATTGASSRSAESTIRTSSIRAPACR